MPHSRRELRITNETRNLGLVRKIIAQFISESPFPQTDRNRIILATDEAIANVVEHAYGRERGLISLTLALDDEKLEILICDNGARFQPKVASDPNIKDHIRLGLKGGLGMFLMRRVMDEVRYSTTPRYNNELDMIKFFPRPEGSA